ncbi:flagellar basal body P-ring protein FlgI [Nitratidesulfovibrio vulgaris]|uniref:Flagellar P-ring protein n=1 Tax=Nitratidesulfovibrio vulgaris (strain DP4) TaxID=391774 RepID=A0A0H3AAS7_NITV4|nr:flagellar basal body P-ring protein FlgI [Nitratidesulfovibrio vulgaris]GEB80701.1 flagellar P-ring protein [Desulfovibrio desulfuricans]HBW17104.1 flagellar basal body P-ring protein FlgI [Desulfovibrio sp.]AAS94998.1 flagellar P-ring protein FlgI [Nitratidesulfovibrio vulgaris str. Hildenborough]ABM29441.1 flagellar P-ring protein [Nitratidesulfovibrio vulgaris DP4]ADP85643.1 flagellar P-ring protein [Nitratidesulfovibrio vulgaris RCH1]
MSLFDRPARWQGVWPLLLAVALSTLLPLAMPGSAGAVRIKDIATFSGVRDNQLVGYGLVVGLGGTGDKKESVFTVSSMVNMLERMGVAVDPKQLKPKNVASVMVTARMPVSAKPGARLDVTVSSMGDATSLLGGVLLQTPLKGVDGKIYGLAQGSLALGGFSAEGQAARAQKNITTVGLIPGGAIIERGVPFEFNQQDRLTLNLSTADFSTAQQVAERLNAAMGGRYANAVDASTVAMDVPPNYRGNLVPLMASVENIEVAPDAPARVVVDEKTGTVVLGRDVRISRVAVAHGSLQVTVQESQQVSQPAPFSQGQTVVTPQTNVNVREENRRLMMIEGATLQELVDGLNAIGATPRDLISILRAMKAAGALHAELEVI